ncbi:hypothetical protein PH30N_07352 [Cutibacterium modestum 30N]|jgi:hypothetical protein|uniref:Uncharacterized protein n=2 Tax=Cutibacterium modestum TaxID=2559073 RepID=A0AAD1KLZ6_9ACTN|nr:hypothetical protein BCB70_06515 [Cutibacterium modestum]EFS72863.1 hypothetical protein HMPREF9621_02765 [Cutibacterium modestum HL037PA2]EFS92957.1 hypothetical protein HMPREF9607_00807 [Cutibacterium modestum HL044PA1]EFT15025.1 hypothetical protein HMPREF9622_01993 [Cutibacterium modestum HL037PA3]EGG25580.1 hypothetical protein PA08_2531 [Cutibacterium modestum P08]MCP2375334.1 hypothetical protein [Cutibacterium modestum 28N]MCP2380815.1 hypothetical protein [Cutibacterium modestum 3
MAQVLTIRDIKLPTMVEEQPPCITGNVAISTTVHLAPNDIGAFTDTDELRILMESARSHGYLSQPQLESRKYLIEEPIGVVISDISQAEYLTLRLDSYPGHHLIGRPGMKTMLVLADALRLIGLSTPQSIDVECIDFDPHGWDLLNPDPDTHMHMIWTLSTEICRWMSPHLTHTWHATVANLALDPELSRDTSQSLVPTGPRISVVRAHTPRRQRNPHLAHA